MSESDLAAILALYGESGVATATPIAAGTINTNFAVTLPGGRRFLRINEGKAREDVVREAAIVAHVAERGVTTPRPLRALSGEAFVPLPGDAAALVSMFPWVEGRTLSRAEVGPEEARAAGRALAELHRAGADFADHRPGRYEPDEIERRCAGIAAGGDAALGDALAVLRPTLAELSHVRVAGLPLGLIHGDLFIDNVLFHEGRLVALLDFEQASWGRLAYDIAVSLLAFAFGREDFRADVTRAFIDGYRAVRLPTADESRGFVHELRFAACRFAVTRITDVYLRRTPGAPAGKDFRRYLARLAAVERHAGSGLLEIG